MKKILIVSGTFFPIVGGIEEQIKILGEEYIKKGFQVDILTKKLQKDWLNHEQIFGFNVTRFKNSLEQIFFLLKYGNSYEIIISRWYYRHSAILGILKFFRLLKTTTIICTDTGGENDEINVIKNASLKFNLYKLYFYIIGQNNYLNCLNKDNVNHLKSIYGGNSKYTDKITRIFNGINISEFTNYKTRKITNIKNILYIGRFEKEKGIIDLINSFKNIKNNDIILNIIGYGDGKIENEIKNLISGDNRIILHGKKYGEEKEKILNKTDLFVFPTYSEGQPVTITEMIIRNIPVITTDTGNTKEIYGDNIVYVKKKDQDDLKEKIEWVIENIGNYKYDYSEVIKKIDIKNTTCSFLKLIKGRYEKF